MNPNNPKTRKPENPHIVFFGSSKYSTIAAKIIHQKLGLSLIITNPDKPSGRKRKITPSPVKVFAKENNIPVLTFEKLNTDSIKRINSTIKPASPAKRGEQSNNETIDFLIVADYGLILPNQVLELAKYAAINVHHSLLPKYRGPSPAPSAILNGEKVSGVTIISMTENVDAGDILAQKEYALKSDETTDSLLIELNKLGGQLAIEVIENYFAHLRGESFSHLGGVRKQDDSKAIYTHRFTKTDGQIDLNDPPDPVTFDRMVRAFYPWPGTWCRLMVNGSPRSPREASVAGVAGKWLMVKFLPGNLIQPEGKKPMTIKEFQNGHPAIAKQLSSLLQFES